MTTSAASDFIRRKTPTTSAHQIDASICLFLIAILIVYGRTLTFDIVNWDDPVYLISNQYVGRGITWEGIKWAFTTTLNGMWHPVTWLSLMGEVSLFGENVSAFHLTNVWLHVANSILAFTILRTVLDSLLFSTIATLVFAVHPINVETVAWISERKGVLGAFWFFLALNSFIRYLKTLSPKHYTVAILFHACSLLSKTTSVTLPALLLLGAVVLRLGGLKPLFGAIHPELRVEYATGTWVRFIWRRFLVLSPFFALACVTSAIAIYSQGEAKTITHELWSYRIGNMIVAYVDMFLRGLIPLNLSALYPSPTAWEPVEVLIKMSLVVTALCVLVPYGDRYPNALFCGGWFFISLLPVSGIIRFGPHYIADRYAYISLWAPLTGLSVWLLQSVTSKAWHVLWGVLVSLTCMSLSVYQISFWQNSEHMWRRVIATGGASAPAYNNLGLYLMQMGRRSEGEHYFRESLAAYPNPEAYINLAELERRRRCSSREMAYLYGGLICLPFHPMMLTYTGIAHQRHKNHAFALSRYEQAIQVDANNSEALGHLANLLLTSFDPSIRDPVQGMLFAVRALQHNQSGPDPLFFGVLQRSIKRGFLQTDRLIQTTNAGP
jgi:hypothetical protein